MTALTIGALTRALDNLGAVYSLAGSEGARYVSVPHDGGEVALGPSRGPDGDGDGADLTFYPDGVADGRVGWQTWAPTARAAARTALGMTDQAEAVMAEGLATPDALGPCGCTDYHLADCPTRTGVADVDPYDFYDRD